LQMTTDRKPLTAKLMIVVGCLCVALGLASCKVSGKAADMAWDKFVSGHRHWIQMDGYRMHYIDMGKGKPVILVHGFADSTYCWHKNVHALLDAGLRVVAVDLPGLGQSDMPPEGFVMSIDNLAGEVLKFAGKMKFETFNLVGSSMGGGITLLLSMNHAERIEKAVVVDPVSFWQGKAAMLMLLDAGPLGRLVAKGAGLWSVRIALIDVYYNDNLVDDILVNEYARPLSKPGYDTLLARLIQEYPSPAAMKMAGQYHELRVPLLIIWGKQDKWVPPEFGPRLHNMAPDSTLLMVEDAGHLPNQEKPEIVNPAIVEFLK
jgi:pimeloyl-ACP methyl ester carboxylesterase